MVNMATRKTTKTKKRVVAKSTTTAAKRRRKSPGPGRRPVEFIATSPKGKKIKGVGIRKFALRYNMNPNSIGKVIRGEEKKHRGWKFKKVKTR